MAAAGLKSYHPMTWNVIERTVVKKLHDKSGLELHFGMSFYLLILQQNNGIHLWLIYLVLWFLLPCSSLYTLPEGSKDVPFGVGTICFSKLVVLTGSAWSFSLWLPKFLISDSTMTCRKNTLRRLTYVMVQIISFQLWTLARLLSKYSLQCLFLHKFGSESTPSCVVSSPCFFDLTKYHQKSNPIVRQWWLNITVRSLSSCSMTCSHINFRVRVWWSVSCIITRSYETRLHSV